jgi:hypothetical protein
MSSFSTLEASLRTLQAIAESYRGQMTPLVEQELLIILAKALAHKSHGAREAAFYLAAALATCIAGKLSILRESILFFTNLNYGSKNCIPKTII